MLSHIFGKGAAKGIVVLFRAQLEGFEHFGLKDTQLRSLESAHFVVKAEPVGMRPPTRP